MTEYLVKGESLTAIADEVRIISGTNNGMSLKVITNNLSEANVEIGEQSDLIDQIIEAANSLPTASGGGGSTVTAILQIKTVTPTKSLQTVTADSGYDGLKKVTVNAIPNEYITTTDATATSNDILASKTAYVNGTKVTGAISTKTASNLITSGATVTVPAGYYAAEVSRSVDEVTQATPSITVDTSGLITATTQQGAGYVISGTKSATKQLTTKGATTYTPTTTSQTIATGIYLTGVQTIQGDANLVAGNIKNGVSIFGVTGTLQEDSGDSTDNYEDKLLDGSLVDYTNNTVTKLRNYAFMSATTLKTVNLSACSHIGQCAFQGCTSLTTANFATCISMASSAFQGCTALKTISFPECKSIYWAGFSTCTSLTTVNLPKCTYLGGRAFQNCSRLATVSLPLCKNIYSSTFQSCKSLATISLPNITLIGSTAFGSCTKLNTIYLTGSSLCTLSGSNAFVGTGITSTSGSIYVNASLVDSYKTATNWAYFTNIIYAAT